MEFYAKKIVGMPKMLADKAFMAVKRIMEFPTDYASMKQTEATPPSDILNRLIEKDTERITEKYQLNGFTKDGEYAAKIQSAKSEAAAKIFADAMKEAADDKSSLVKTRLKKLPNGDVVFAHGGNFGRINKNGEMYLIDEFSASLDQLTEENARLFAWAGDVLKYATKHNVESHPEYLPTHSSWFDVMQSVGIDKHNLSKDD